MSDATKPPEAKIAPDAPSAETRRRARGHWEQAVESLRQARKAAKSGDALQSGYLSLQGAINALRALCMLYGHMQPPAYSPSALAALLAAEAPELAALGEPSGALEAIQALNPFAARRDPAAERQQAAEALAHGDAVLSLVRAHLKANRALFFAP